MKTYTVTVRAINDLGEERFSTIVYTEEQILHAVNRGMGLLCVDIDRLSPEIKALISPDD
jgi:hypothetical protein